jgi:hypothetical protein
MTDSSHQVNMDPRGLYEAYSGAVAYVEAEDPNGDLFVGTAFHIGSGVFITARHVVEDCKIVCVRTTTTHYIPDPNGHCQIHGEPGRFRIVGPSEGIVRSGPYFHPDSSIDIAVLMIDGLEPPAIPLGSHLDDWMNDEAFILAQIVVMGYPPIPFSKTPVLVAARGEVNAVVDKDAERHPHFVVSTMARGGFSGGPCLVEWGFALGLVTESLMRRGDLPLELGYMAVLTVEPIFTCLQYHKLVPKEQKEGWDGLWDDREKEELNEALDEH